MPNYHKWVLHGEQLSDEEDEDHVQGRPFTEDEDVGEAEDIPAPEVASTSYHEMVHDLAGPSFTWERTEEQPNIEAQQLYNLIDAANEQLWTGCETMTQLSAMARLMTIKADHRLSERAYDDVLHLWKDSLPVENRLPNNFYETKRFMQGLGLPVEKIDCCTSNCMLFWGDDVELQFCKFCGEQRYQENEGTATRKLRPRKQMYYFPLKPRLQRLFASESTAVHMRWHAEHVVEEGVMQHCSDALAWKHFNETNPNFSSETRNVRLGLCTDGFQPFGMHGKQFSSWPVIVTPYNLPPSMCLKKEVMFLTVIVPGPKNPSQLIDVFLQPLVKELLELWNDGVHTYDVSTKTNFLMRAALMWTVSDFPAYGMLSGWGTHGATACPHCMDDIDTFWLRNSRKMTWFDCHRRFLPRYSSLRRDPNKFRRGKTVSNGPPRVKTGVEILDEIDRKGLMKVTDLGAKEINAKISQELGWKKKSIFWDLPYWKTNLVQHNLDVMHIEKNVFDNLFNTVMGIPGKTKDNVKIR